MDRRPRPEPLLSDQMHRDDRPAPGPRVATASRGTPPMDTRPGRAGRGFASRRRMLAALLATPVAAALSSGGPRSLAAAPAAQQDEPFGTIVAPRDAELALVGADGYSERTLLTLGGGALASDVAWSPDGGRIAFSVFTERPGEPGGADIAVVVASGEATEAPILVPRDQPGTLLASPVWSPDGSGLAFENVGPTVQVEWIGMDGSGRRLLADGGRFPTLSRDGGTLAYVKSASSGDGIWARPFAGGPESQVVAEYELLAVAFPRFSPDGGRLAFAGVGDLNRAPAMRTRLIGQSSRSPVLATRLMHGLPWDLFVVDLSGANLRRLAFLSEDDAAIAWSPDGRWIAVGSATGLRLVSLADGGVRVISTLGSYGGIDWR